MLILTRRRDEVFRIGDNIAVTVLDLHYEVAMLQVDYPAGLRLQGAAFEIRRGDDVGPPGAAPPATPSRLRATVVLRLEDTLAIGDRISVKAVGFPKEHAVQLGIQAPRELSITRDDYTRGKPPPA